MINMYYCLESYQPMFHFYILDSLNFREDFYFFYDFMDVSAGASQKAYLTPQMKLLQNTAEVSVYFEYGMGMENGDLCK